MGKELKQREFFKKKNGTASMRCGESDETRKWKKQSYVPVIVITHTVTVAWGRESLPSHVVPNNLPELQREPS